jgi:hypothetical protein
VRSPQLPPNNLDEPDLHKPGDINLEASIMEGAVSWCPGPESNRYVSFETRDFKSRASASFATRAYLYNKINR